MCHGTYIDVRGKELHMLDNAEYVLIHDPMMWGTAYSGGSSP